MDFATALIGLAVLAAITLPFLLMGRSQGKQDKQLQAAFSQAAAQNGLNIAQKDFWARKYGIGIDPHAHKLLYLKMKGEEQKILLIDLAQVEKCRLVNQSRGVKTHQTAGKVIEHLELRFTFHQPGTAEQVVEFYNVDESLTMGKEVLLMEKWNQLVQEQLTAKKPVKQAVS
jgi:hypothetical protein